MQSRFGADEGPPPQIENPGIGLLECRCHLVVNLVVAWRVEPPQVSSLRSRPIFQIGARLLGVPGLVGIQRIKMLIERTGDLAGRARATIALDEELP